MARGEFNAREGVIIKLAGARQAAYSELLPLEHFGTESLSDALNFLNDHTKISSGDLDSIPADLPATKFAIETALLELSGRDGTEKYYQSSMPLSKLLPSDPTIFSAVETGLQNGFSIFKLKIGMRDFNDEFQVVKQVASMLPGDQKIRIDANEGLSLELARKWLSSLEKFRVEFLEQPLQRQMIEETIQLSEEFPTEVALDESIATSQDIIDTYNQGFRGVFASKPLRLAELQKFLCWRDTTEAKISYSTIFETSIGSSFGIKLAASDKHNRYGLGYGTGDWFEESDLVLASKSEYHIDEILSIDKDMLWANIPVRS